VAPVAPVFPVSPLSPVLAKVIIISALFAKVEPEVKALLR
jgi:hypothetical protein